jgi:2-octaprenyl-6-methoxyphenol hydroxylase
MDDARASPSDLHGDVAIVGAGPSGTLLAILLAERGFRTSLIDARPEQSAPAQDGRTFAIVRGSWRLLGAAGVTSALAKVSEPLNGLEAMDGGRHFFGVPAVAFGTDDLPGDPLPFGFMVPAMTLQAELDANAAIIPNLNWLRGVRFENFAASDSARILVLSDGTRVSAKLVIACDGAASPVRQALRIKTEGRAYRTHVLAANVTLEQPHGGIARQLFTSEGPFATLPLPGNRANLAWYIPSLAAEALVKLPAADIAAELNARFAGFAGRMEIDSTITTYPLSLQVVSDMIAPRAALAGDAAHRINPLAGQGLNLGFKDVAALVDVLEEARYAGLDPGSDPVLKQYREARRFDAMATALFMDGVDRLYSNRLGVLKPIKGLALATAAAFDPLRRIMARQAGADQAHLPSLMRGA